MMSGREAVQTATTIARTYGARGALLRGIHEMRRRVNAFQLEPSAAAAENGADVPRLIQVDGARLRAVVDADAATARADRIVAGEYLAFGHDWRALPKDAESWHRHPVTAHLYDRADAWWHIPHVSRVAGDIKDVWEPARFAWAFDLCRGFLVSGDLRYPDAFARIFTSWDEANPAFRGVHWSCGQETAIRAVALLYAESILGDALNQATRKRLSRVLAASGERIDDAMGYAISQRNNHGISEATGLVSLGVRLRDHHARANAWLVRGAAWLDRLIGEQFAADGWYVQHSFNYLRVALDQCVVAQRMLVRAGRSIAPASVERLGAACRLLVEVIDAPTGSMPNHGPNDGAWVHPISLASIEDFRPTLTATCATFDHALPTDIRADAEALAWLQRPEPRRSRARQDGVAEGASGWAVARCGRTSMFLRAGKYRSRPGHIDALHVDIRLNGKPIVVDPGTFSYNSAPPWNNGLADARVHNGPMVDGRMRAARGPRFLWLSWPEATIVRAQQVAPGCAELVAEARDVRRSVSVTKDRVVVTDEMTDTRASRMRICWLLHPDADLAAVSCSAPWSVVEGAGDVTGWYSPYYGKRMPSRALIVDTADRSVTTTFGARGPANA